MGSPSPSLSSLFITACDADASHLLPNALPRRRISGSGVIVVPLSFADASRFALDSLERHVRYVGICNGLDDEFVPAHSLAVVIAFNDGVSGNRKALAFGGGFSG